MGIMLARMAARAGIDKRVGLPVWAVLVALTGKIVGRPAGVAMRACLV